MIQVKNWSLAALAVLSVLVSFHARASVTYDYTGNPFAWSESGLANAWITASVTFSDPLINSSFTGDVYANSISAWSIEVPQVAGSELNNTNAWNGGYDLWFHFESGSITDWQLVAAQGSTVLYTTNDSPYQWIWHTGDYYRNSAYAASAVQWNAGSWTTVATPIPAAVWLFGSALAGLGFIGKRSSFRKETCQSLVGA